MKQVALVSGSGGFIGSHLCVKLTEHNITVHGFSRSGKSKNDEYNALVGDKIVQHKGDVTDFDYSMLEGIKVDYIFHVAGKVSVWGNIKEFRKINVEGTRRMLEYAKTARPKCFVYFSSAAVYGFHGYTNLTEDAPMRPFKNPYPITKIEAEKLVEAECRAAGIPFVIIRPANVYGEYDFTSSYEIYDRISRCKMMVPAHGKYKSCFVYAGNLADAAITACMNKDAHNTDYNVSDGNGETLTEYFTCVADCFGVRSKFKSAPAWLSKLIARIIERTYKILRIKKAPLITKFSVWQNCADYHFSIDKIKAAGHIPKLSQQEAVQKTVNWYKEHQNEKN